MIHLQTNNVLTSLRKLHHFSISLVMPYFERDDSTLSARGSGLLC
jgi:hypothetical protein